MDLFSYSKGHCYYRNLSCFVYGRWSCLGIIVLFLGGFVRRNGSFSPASNFHGQALRNSFIVIFGLAIRLFF